MKISVD
jgi:Helicase associated domain (HA2)